MKKLYDILSQYDWAAFIGTALFGLFYIGVIGPIIGHLPAHQNPSAFWIRTKQDPVAFYTFVMSIFTAVLAISTIGLWWMTGMTLKHAREDAKRQARQMRFSNIAARHAADAANVSARAAVRAQLPIIRIFYPSLYNPGEVADGGTAHGGAAITGIPVKNACLDKLAIVNIGQTSAFPDKISLGWFIGETLPESPPKCTTTVPLKGGEVFYPVKPEITVDECIHNYRPNDLIIRLNEDERIALTQNVKFLWVFAVVEFVDFMGRSRISRICWKWGREGANQGDYYFSRDTHAPKAYFRIF